MIVASAGGGSVGKPLLESAMRAFQKFSVDSSARLFVYTGPYIDAQDFAYLTIAGKAKGCGSKNLLQIFWPIWQRRICPSAWADTIPA